jgi:hypothetical protein
VIARIEVEDRAERNAIETALSDPEVRAFVVVVGNLLPFSPRARARMLSFVGDSLADRPPLDDDEGGRRGD